MAATGGTQIALAAVLCLVVAAPAQAQEETRWWLTATVRSYHFDRGTRHNEANYGLGVEYEFNEKVSAGAGQYINSRWRESTYAVVNVAPLSLGPVRFGATAGLISGYGNRVVPLLAPTATVGGKTWGANLLAIPPFDNGSWVLGLQVKRRF